MVVLEYWRTKVTIDERLKKYVRPDQPFGPVDAADIVEPECAAALYEWNNKTFADMLLGSDVLVGRRGSGKSSLLRSLRARRFLQSEFRSESGKEFRRMYHIPSKALHQSPPYVVEVDTPSNVSELAEHCNEQSNVPPVEMLAEWWKKRIWWLVGRKLQENANWDDVPPTIKSYVSNDDVSAIINFPGDTERPLTPDQYISELTLYCQRSNIRVVVTFDNVENHVFNPISNAVLGGLIAATGKFIGAQHPCLDVKLCLPAELFGHIEKICFRPDKDLHTVQYLHWNAAELMHLAARRLRVYLELWNPEEFDLIKDDRILDRSSLMGFWERYLPRMMKNSLNVDESSITYILRHTQLLPRQLISILNAICKRSRSGGLFDKPFTDQEVVKGVEDSERTNVGAIRYMFEKLYPDIDDVFEAVMPRLSREFDYGHLQRVWHSSAKKSMAEMGKANFIDFWQLMLSTGAIGLKVENESTPKYSVARFSFNTKYDLSISDKDRLCVHPMFSRIYNVAQPEDAKLVLPRGSDFLIDRETI